MGSVTRTAEGNLASFRTCLKRPLESLKVTFGPVQDGSGDPSPTNVRAISGHDSVSVEACGKNLINLSECVYGYWTSDDGIVIQNNRGVRSQYIKVKPMSDITMSTNGTIPYSFSIIELDANGAFVKRTHKSLTPASYTQLSIRTQEATVAVYCQTYNNTDEGATPEWLESIKWQLEIGSATAYEAYSGSTHSVSWQTDAGTVYGGYVDLVTGELVVTHKRVTFDGSSDFAIQSSSMYVLWQNIEDMASGNFYSDSDVMCDKAIKVSSRGSYSGDLQIRFGANTNTIYLYYLNEYAGTTGESATVRAWLDANPITVTYPLATPIHYQLTPQQIETLIGRNNIWSEQGSVSVRYLDKDTKDLLWAQRRAMMFAIPTVDRFLIYRLPQPTVFGNGAAAQIDTGVVLLPTNRALTIEIDLTPGTISNRSFAFYAGMYESPYYWVGLEYRNSTWKFSAYSSQIVLTNLSDGNRCRIVARKENASNTFDVYCYDGKTMVYETVTDSRITSDNNLFVGGYSDATPQFAYVGLISEFSAYARFKTDAEVNHFLYGLT